MNHMKIAAITFAIGVGSCLAACGDSTKTTADWHVKQFDGKDYKPYVPGKLSSIKGLEDCVGYPKIVTPNNEITVVRCPNSSTTTSLTSDDPAIHVTVQSGSIAAPDVSVQAATNPELAAAVAEAKRAQLALEAAIAKLPK